MADVMYPEVLVSGQGPIKVAAVGDSLTYGYGLDNREQDAYPSILADLLGGFYQVHNFGLAGRSLQSTADYPYFEEKNAHLSLELDASFVVIMIGTNDSRAAYWEKERFEVEYRQMVASYQALPSQPEVMLVIPPHIPTSRFGLDNEKIRIDLQELLPQIAADYQTKLVNLYPLTEGQDAYYSDGLHLTPLGNQVVAQAVYQAFLD